MQDKQPLLFSVTKPGTTCSNKTWINETFASTVMVTGLCSCLLEAQCVGFHHCSSLCGQSSHIITCPRCFTPSAMLGVHPKVPARAQLASSLVSASSFLFASCSSISPLAPLPFLFFLLSFSLCLSASLMSPVWPVPLPLFPSPVSLFALAVEQGVFP